jgi:diguanylate cyclase (GGDEF)-like protein/PAS domain S-box-containing protein
LRRRRIFRTSIPTLTKRIWSLFGIALCALLLLIAAAMTGLHRVVVERAAISRTMEVERTLLALGEDLLDAETGQRGYLLTTNTEFLEPYSSGAADAHIRLRQLGVLMPDPAGKLFIDKVTPLVSAKLEHLAQTVALARKGDLDAAQSVVAAGNGKRLMDAFRVIRTDTLQTQRRLLDEQKRDVETSIFGTVLVLVIGGVATIGLLLFHARRAVRKLGDPIKALVDGMLAVAGGSTERRLTVSSADEVGMMAAAFNTMTERLATAGRVADDATLELQRSHDAMCESAQSLRASQSFLARTGAAAGVGGWELNLSDGSIVWSDETKRLHDVEPEYQPTLERSLEFYTPGSRATLERSLEACRIDGLPWELELELISAKGRHFWARATGAAEFEGGVAMRIVGAFQDITERRRLECELSESYELVRVTLESIGDAVITTDQDGLVQWLNPVAEAMTGWTRHEAHSKPLTQVFNIRGCDSREASINPVAVCLEEGRTVGLPGHTTLMSRNGSEFGIEDSASPIRDSAGRTLGAVLVFHDVTEQRRLSHEMSHRAAHDSLTGLVNRAEFEGRLERLLSGTVEDARAHVVMFIDLDEFKVVNDACGHAAGDQLLRQVSNLLQQGTRNRDTVARLGGDEFGIILENCGLDRGQAIGQKICEQMDSYRFAHAGRRSRIGTSIGIVPVDCRWRTAASVMQAADGCCYAAKEAGRNRVHVWFESDGSQRVRQAEMQWVNRLEAAMDEERFILYAQHIEPIAGRAERLHCEVLLRLREDGRLILPGAFLSAADRFHLAARIDRWVITRLFAMLQAEAVAANQIHTISINLSGQSMGDREFRCDLIEIIRKALFDVRILCFEITETVAINHLPDARALIEEIRALGARVALDDFGAGASSFRYLRTLPVDFLKIDGQFITRLLDDPLDHAAVRSFCEVARVLGVKTVAEFVERADIRDELIRLGVDMAQGYLIHRAEPLSSLLPKKVHVVEQACGIGIG